MQLESPLPGEPPYLRRRTFPRAIRFFKQKEDVDPYKFYLQQLILFHPFRSENEFPKDAEECKIKYFDNETKINRVQAKVMPFMVSVQKARSDYNENKENEEPDLEGVATMLDPENEQEIMDAEDEEEEEHPEYLHIDPDQIEEEPKGEKSKEKRIFRSIEIPSIEVRLEEARQLDKMQRHVLEVGLQYAKGIVKARKGKVIAIVTEGNTGLNDLADHVIEVPETENCLSPIINTIPLQGVQSDTMYQHY